MKKDIISSSRLGESYIKVKHDSGLNICLYPMPGFSTAPSIPRSKPMPTRIS